MSAGLLVRVEWVTLPAWSSVGFGRGEVIDSPEVVEFAGDHRLMRDLGQAVEEAGFEVLDLPIVELEPYQVLARRPLA